MSCSRRDRVRLFSVYGVSGSGKTTTIEQILRELIKRGKTVGTVKDIHFEQFAMDTKGTNTHRHKEAGAQLVSAWGQRETDILYQRRLSLLELLTHYNEEYVILEGVSQGNFPKIITAHNETELLSRVDGFTFLIAGKVAARCSEYQGIPVLDARTRSEEVVDLILQKVYPRLPDFPKECCNACGFSCGELGQKILRGEASPKECVLKATRVQLQVNGTDIPMVPFVQRVLENSVKALVKELDGYQEGAEITVQIAP